MKKDIPKILFGTGVSAAKERYEMQAVVSSALKHRIRGFDTADFFISVTNSD